MGGPAKSQLGWALGFALLLLALSWTHTAEAQLSIHNALETLIEAFRLQRETRLLHACTTAREHLV